MKTVIQVFEEHHLADHPKNEEIIAGMTRYAEGVAEAVRDACMEGLEYEDSNRIQQIDLDQFIK